MRGNEFAPDGMYVWGEPVSNWDGLGEALGENTVTFQNTSLGFSLFSFFFPGFFTEEHLTLQKFFPKLCRFPTIPLDLDGFEVPRVGVQSDPEPLSPLRGGPARCPPTHLAILPLRAAVPDHQWGLSISQEAAVKFFYLNLPSTEHFLVQDESWIKGKLPPKDLQSIPCPWWQLQIIRPTLLPTDLLQANAYTRVSPQCQLEMAHSVLKSVLRPSI